MIYAFGRFELHPEQLELRADGARVDVQPKVLELLLHLLRHRARVVGKRELFEALWPGVVVGESALTRAMSAARAAIGDTGGEGSLIRTHARVGYRFVAAVDERAATAATQATRAREPARSVFVGRAALLAELRAAWEGARAGEGRVLLLAGEAGIGKTRTAQALAEIARASGALVLEGWCWDESGAPPYWPWAQLVRGFARGVDDATLRPALGSGAAELAALVPELGARLRLRASRPGDTEGARFALLDALAGFLRRVAESAPLLVFLDDLHWADEASLRALEFAARELAGARILLVGAYRREELRADHPLLATLSRLARGRHDARIALSGLEAREVTALAESVSEEPLDREVTSELFRRSGGNPLYVKELVMLFAQRGTLEGELPAGVRGVIQARLSRLSERCRELVALAAVAGREVDYEILRRASGQDAERALAALDEAAAAGVLHPRGGATERWEFAHDLLREALLESLPGVDRLRLHRRVAETLELLHARDLDAVAGALATHWSAVARAEGAAEPAVGWCLRAAEAALARLAYEDAVAHCERAFELLELCGASDAERLPVWLALARSRARAADAAGANAASQRAAALARASGRVEDLAAAALAPIVHAAFPAEFYGSVRALLEEAARALEGRSAPLRAQLLARLAYVLRWDAGLGFQPAGRDDTHDQAHAFAREALALTSPDGDAFARVAVLFNVLYGVWERFSPAERQALTSEFVGLEARLPTRAFTVDASPLRITALLEQGDVAAVDAEIARATRRLEGMELAPVGRWYLSVHRGMRALLSGRLEEAEACVGALGQQAQRTGIYDFVRAWGAQLCQLRIDQGRAAEIEPWLRGSLAGERDSVFRAVRSFVLSESGRLSDARLAFEHELERGLPNPSTALNAPVVLVVLATVCAELRDAASAPALYERLLPLREQYAVNLGAWICLGSIEWPLGKLAAASGRLDLAASHLERAIVRNAALGANTYATRARVDLGRVLLERQGAGDLERARLVLAEAHDAATAIGMERLAAAARELRNQALGVPVLAPHSTRRSGS